MAGDEIDSSANDVDVLASGAGAVVDGGDFTSPAGGLSESVADGPKAETPEAAVTRRTAMRRINLLPPEVVQQRNDVRVRRRVLASLGGLVLALVAVWLVTSMQSSSVRSELAAQKEANATLERQISADALQEPVRKQEEVDERVAALGTVLGQEVAFPRMLRELSRVMPPSMYLDSVDLSVAVQGASSRPKNSSSTKKQPVVSIDTFTQDLRLSARAGGEMDLTAEWLDRTKLWPVVDRAWLNNQTKVETDDRAQEIDFATTLRLNGAILSERAQRLARGELP